MEARQGPRRSSTSGGSSTPTAWTWKERFFAPLARRRGPRPDRPESVSIQYSTAGRTSPRRGQRSRSRSPFEGDGAAGSTAKSAFRPRGGVNESRVIRARRRIAFLDDAHPPLCGANQCAGSCGSARGLSAVSCPISMGPRKPCVIIPEIGLSSVSSSDSVRAGSPSRNSARFHGGAREGLGGGPARRQRFVGRFGGPGTMGGRGRGRSACDTSGWIGRPAAARAGPRVARANGWDPFNCTDVEALLLG